MHSLAMQVEVVDGMYVIDAPWLDEPVIASTFEEAYEEALRRRQPIGHLSATYRPPIGHL